MKIAIWAPASVMALLAGCCLKSPCPQLDLRLPPAAEVEHVEVMRWQPNGSLDTAFTISDGQRIEELLSQLQSVNSDFYRAPVGQKPQEYSLAFEGGKGLKAMVWIGPDWLGGVDSRHQDQHGVLTDRHRQLEPEDHQTLISLLNR